MTATLLPTAPSANLLRFLAYVYGYLAFMSLLTVVVPALRRPGAAKLRGAINGWWPPALAGGLIVLGGPLVATIVVSSIALLALNEFLRLAVATPSGRAARATARALVLTLPAVMWLYGAATCTAAFVIGALVLLPLASLVAHGPAGFLESVPRAQLGVGLCGYSLAHLLLPWHTSPSGGAGPETLVALLLVSVMGNDAAQYVTGKLLGRHRLAPVISPNKTWEGFTGGAFITALIGGVTAGLLAPWSPSVGAAIGLLTAALGLLGDLLISAVKRDAGVKDTGTALGAHGGVLDRADSLLLAAPAFVYVSLTLCTSPWT